jgi:MFS family permease
VLVAQGATGSLAIAGATTAAFGLGAGLGRPVQGALIDRWGPRPVLLAAAALHGAALSGNALIGAAGGPGVALVATGALGGLGEPSVSASMRILLGRLVPHQREESYALITLTQELGILLGPVLLGALVFLLSAPAALAILGLAAAAGALWFCSLEVTRGHPPALTGRPRLVRITRGLLTVLLVATLFGLATGAEEVAIPAFALERDQRAVSGLLVGLVSVGGLAGGLALGAGRRSSPASRRAAGLLAGIALALAALALAPSIAVLAPLLLLAGVPMTPAVTNLALLVDDETGSGGVAQAFGWLSTSIATGFSLGSATAGALAQHQGSGAAFWEAAIGAALAGAAALLGSRWLDSDGRWPSPSRDSRIRARTSAAPSTRSARRR